MTQKLAEKKECKIKCSAKTVLSILVPIAIIGVVFVCVVKATDGKSGPVLAKINGHNIYESQVKERVAELIGYSDVSQVDLTNHSEDEIKWIIKDLYSEEKVNKSVKRSKFYRSKEVKKKANDYRIRLARKEFLDDMVSKSITDEKIKAKYDDIVKNFTGKKELDIAHILVKSEDQANSIRNSLSSGVMTFDEAARKFSIDTASATQGGRLGYIIENSLDKDFVEAAIKLKSGELSKPVKTQFGYHLIKLYGKRDVVIPEFEKIKDKIKTQLSNEIISEYATGFVKDEDIEYKLENLKKSDAKSLESSDDKNEAKDGSNSSKKENDTKKSSDVNKKEPTSGNSDDVKDKS